jgi:glutamate N-acetyltransferase/amino-acid N-acetyltransferase
MQDAPKAELLNDPGGICDCPGYRTAAAACDVRGNGSGQLDLALIVSETPSSAAGVFTLNDVCAAPVRWCREVLAHSAGAVAGCVVNSGNANACTGAEGGDDAREMAAQAAIAAGAEAPFLVCSTGRIGRRLPMDRIRRGIESAAAALGAAAQNSLDAADAILTSDTRRKVATARFRLGGRTVTVAGMAKGAGMIEPNMATMLAFLASDITAPPEALQEVLAEAVGQTFNRISVDGDMSTNDSVLLFANGGSGVGLEEPGALPAFREAVLKVCHALAEKIVGDGEKVTRLVEVVVRGARSGADAARVARAVGNSLLVKTSWYGGDPNWGRLADAAGYARVGLEEDRLDIFYDDVPALLGGRVQEGRLAEWKRVAAKNRFRITLDLHQGEGHYRLLASDLSPAYVDFNKSE